MNRLGKLFRSLFPRGRGLGLCVLLFASLSARSNLAEAQQKEDPLKVQRGTGGTGQLPPGVGVIQQQQRPFYVQGAVVAVLTGGAVWTVCRGSRRQ